MQNKGIYYLIFSILLAVLVTVSIIFLGKNQNNSISQTRSSSKPASSAQTEKKTKQEKEGTVPLVAETDDYQAIEKIQKENPWIELVPIVESNYITRYIYDNNSIEIVVYTNGGNINYSKEELDSISNSVEKTLKERGVPLESVKINLRIE